MPGISLETDWAKRFSFNDMIRLGAQFAAVVILFGALVAREFRLQPLAGLEEMWRDLLSRGSATAGVPASGIVQVEIEETALDDLGWPWAPLDFAVFLQSAIPLDPPIIAVEAPFSFDPTRLKPDVAERLPQYQGMLLDQVHRTPRLVLGSKLGFPEDPQVVPPLEAVPVLRRVNGSVSGVAEFTAIESWSAEEYRLSTQPGFTNVPEDGRLPINTPLVLRYRGQLVPTFPLHVLMALQRALPDDVTVEIGSHIQVGGRLRVPIDSQGRMPVNLAVPIERISYLDFLRTRTQNETAASGGTKGAFHRRPLLLIRTDAAARTLRWPGRPAISPGQLMAAAVATAKLGAFRLPTPPWADWMVIGTMAAVAFWLPRVRWTWVAYGSIGAILLWGAAAWLTSLFADVILPIGVPVSLAIFTVMWRATLPLKIREPRPLKPLRFSETP
jgi:hypothetical protein